MLLLCIVMCENGSHVCLFEKWFKLISDLCKAFKLAVHIFVQVFYHLGQRLQLVCLTSTYLYDFLADFFTTVRVVFLTRKLKLVSEAVRLA